MTWGGEKGSVRSAPAGRGPVPFVITLGLVIAAAMFYSLDTGLRMSYRYASLVDAAKEVKLEAFRAIAVQRWETTQQLDASPEVARGLDTVFNDFLAQADAAEAALQARMSQDLRWFRILQGLLIACCLGLTTVTAIVFRRYERQQALDRSALQTSEEKLSITLDYIGDAVIATDAAATITRMNPVAEALTGWSAEEARDRPLSDVFHIVNAQTRETIDSPVAKVLREGAVVGPANHTALIARDGRERQIAYRGAPIRDGNGAIDGVVLYVSIGEDIDERNRAELERDRLTRAIEQALDTVVITDANGTIEYVNPAFERTRGYTSEEVVGKKTSVLKSGKHDDAFYQKMWETLVQGEPWSGTIVNKMKNGEHITEEMTISPVRDATGKTVNYVSVQHDVTETMRLEQQYRQAQRVDSIGRLAGGVAHDLNNLLSPILGFGELLMEELDTDDERREHVDEILMAAMRARDLVRQLLAFSRKQTLEYRAVDMHAVISSFAKLLRRTIPENIEIKVLTSGPLPTVKADTGQIEQVIMNLAVNAADAMPGVGRLTLETAAAELDEEYAASHEGVEPGAYVMLAVSDTGCGMDDETRENLFEPFYTTKGEQGSGLGLATVYGIVKQHGGNVWLYSEPGKGTTIKVYLPASEGIPVEKDDRRDPPLDLRGSETILLVEDNEQVRQLALRILARLGYDVLVANAGAEALEILASLNRPVDLLLTDVIMPGMNGKELFTRASEADPHLKVLYMSGYTDSMISHHGVLDKNTAFLNKPFTIHSLAVEVRKVLENVDEGLIRSD